MKDFNTDEDRISILPKEIIHNIMGRLTMLDTVRTNCLSQAWKSFGVSLPYLNIDHNNRDLSHRWLKDFMARKVSSMSIQGEHLVMYKFKLCLDYLLVDDAKEEIRRCIKLVSETSTIKDFDFQIPRDVSYVVRDHDIDTIFHDIYDAKTLNTLRLGGLTLAQPSGEMKLSSLQSLHLEKVNIHTQSDIGRFFTSCPMMREIRLVDCGYLKHLKVSGLNRLQKLEIGYCHALISVEIQAPGLEKLTLSEIRRSRFDEFVFVLEIDSQTCETLNELTLCNSTIRGSSFSRVFSGCKNVESLVLDRCLHFFKIKIASQKLRKLVVRRCLDLLVTDISAPNLTSFSFCNFFWDYPPLSSSRIEKIIHQQDCMLDFTQILRTKSIWISLWFDKFKDIEGQKMVIYPKSGNYSVVIVLEDWSYMAELSLMTKICEEAAKTIITTMSFLDLADYVERNRLGDNKLKNIITIASTNESKFFKAIKKKKPTTPCKRRSFVEKVSVDAFLSKWCCMPSDNDIDGFPYKALLQVGITGAMKATQFSIPYSSLDT